MKLDPDAFRPPDQMRSPCSAATESRAKRKDHINVAEIPDQKSNRKSETRWLALVGGWRQSDSHLKWSWQLRSERRDSHLEETE